MVVAIVAIGMIVSSPAQAGSPTKKVTIKFKNIRTQPVVINAKGTGGNTGGVALAQNGIFSSSLKPGAFTAYATGVNNVITKTLAGKASSAPIYLFVEADNTTTTITVAPPF
jgi:hypothetical protein